MALNLVRLKEFFAKVDDGEAKIVIVGNETTSGGGREHALARICVAAGLRQVYGVPGNAGFLRAQRFRPADTAGLLAFAKEHAIDAIIVGPEAPLVNGLIDHLNAAGIVGVGPTRTAAELEASKAFTIELCQRFGIRTPLSVVASDAAAARHHAEKLNLRVVKKDGLAAGKGVRVCDTLEDTYAAIHEAFAEGAGILVLQERLYGPDISAFRLCDGVPEHARPAGVAYDRKYRFPLAYEGENPMTGGIGGCAFPDDSSLSRVIQEEVERDFALPILRALEIATGAVFQGVLYLGLMRGADGQLRLIEINVRWGDPECQLVATRYEPKSLLKNMVATACHGGLSIAPPLSIIPGREASVGVTLVRSAYPGPLVEPPSNIRGIQQARDAGHKVYLGAVEELDGTLYAVGGRVMTIVHFGKDIPTARKELYRGPFPEFDDRDYLPDVALGIT